MPTPKGHPPYAGCEKGGAFGYLGQPDAAFTEEECHELGKGLVAWIEDKGNIWCKYYFAKKGILWDVVIRLGNRYESFKAYLDLAKSIQESKLCTEPYFKKADANHARFMLARHHKGDWEDKLEATGTDQQAAQLDKSLHTVEYLQALARKIEESSNKTETKS